jgi:ribosome production factor 2
MIMKGRKSSKTMNDLLKDLQLMKGRDMVQMLMRRTHDFVAMEDASLIENQSVKYDCSLFAVGSHQKKRPDNLVLGRVFDGHVLDMFELGVTDFKGTNLFETAKHITADLKPIMIFQGEHFETNDQLKRLKSLLIGKLNNSAVAPSLHPCSPCLQTSSTPPIP